MGIINDLNGKFRPKEHTEVYCIWKKTLAPQGVLYVCGCDEGLALFKRDYKGHERCPCCHKLIQYVGLNGKVIK